MQRIALCLVCLVTCIQLNAQTKADSISYNERSIRNLSAFAQMYGAFRYFYPSEKLAKINWERFIEDGIPRAAAAKSDDELVPILNSYYGSADVVVSTNSEEHVAAAGSGKFKYWKHRGYGVENDLNKGFRGFLYKVFGPYRSSIVSEKVKKNDQPNPDSLYSYRLSDGLTLYMRHARYKHEKLPEKYREMAKTLKRKKKGKSSDNDNTTFRIATAIYICAALENFYPYPEFVSQTWDELLPGILSKAVSDTSNQQFLNSLRALMNELNDGHALAMVDHYDMDYKPPLDFVLIDSNIVLKNCESCDSLGVKIGDILLEVNGKDALQVLTEDEKLWSSASPGYKNYCSLYSFIDGAKNSMVELKFKSAENTVKTLTLKRTHTWVKPSYKLPADTVFNSNIVYLNLLKAKTNLIYKTIADLKPNQSLIIDNRGYPKQFSSFLKKLTKVKKMESQKWLVPVYRFPFQVKMEYDTSNWEWTQSKKHIPDSCKVVFLTNYKAISASETLMSIVKYYKVGTIIGETTAATNGEIIYFGFGNTFYFVFTGMKVLNQDGSQFHGVGVKPDIEVKQTVEGIRAGRDEVLEYAIHYLESN